MTCATDSTVVQLTEYDEMSFSRAQEDLPQYPDASCKASEEDVHPHYFSPRPSHTSQGSHDSIAFSSISLDDSQMSELDNPSNVSYDDPGTIDEKLSMYWRAANEMVIREPYDYIAEIPGKEIRRKLLDAFNEMVQSR